MTNDKPPTNMNRPIRLYRMRKRLLHLLAIGITVIACLAMSPVALASSAPVPVWSITSASWPTNFNPGDVSSGYFTDDQYVLTATNVGDAPTAGPIDITDELPPGVTMDPVGAWGYVNDQEGGGRGTGFPGSCENSGQIVDCSVTVVLVPGTSIQIDIPLDIASTLSGTVTNRFYVTGGAPPASGTDQTTISPAAPSFGLLPGQDGFSASLTNGDGTPDTQAGSTPFQMTVGVGFPTKHNTPPRNPGNLKNGGHVKDLTVNLPPGLIVNPTATPRCTEAQLESDSYQSTGGGCPDDTQIGLVNSAILTGGPFEQVDPIYNMVPPPGVPMEIGFDVAGLGTYVHLMGGVRTGSDYALDTTSDDILAKVALVSLSTTLWGNPTDPVHDTMRGLCIPDFGNGGCTGGAVPASPVPLLRLPSACSSSLTFSASFDSWENPGTTLSGTTQPLDSSGDPVPVTGCDQQSFSPSLSVQPTVSTADSPTGLNVDLSVPQDENSSDLATANLKDSTVTLPAGVSVDPSSADGLAACTPSEIGLDNSSEPSCPDASKIGSVEIDTPVLPDAMTGGVYVAQQNNNPFDSLLAIYVTAEADGALIKLAGHVVADPVTGQLTTTFSNNPQLPFTDFKLDFFNGPRAALATPMSCGTYTTTSSETPWSGTLAVTPSDSFGITSGCATQFHPTFVAGGTNIQAGHYGPFELSFARTDQDQVVSGLSVKLPPGLVAKLAGVPLCTDAEIAQAQSESGMAEKANSSCPASSQVGMVESWAGAGSDPFSLPGKVYLTGPYKGAPYGMVVIVPAVAGPYDLGNVVVRQALDINPTTAQVTAVSDPLPTILQGIPLRVRQINVDLNRPDFTINPTSCDPMSVTGTLTSATGQVATDTSRFQVAGCSSLGFSPKLGISLTGKGQTKSGKHPTLNATLTQPAGQANLSHVQVKLPLSLALDPNNSQIVCPYAIASKVTTGPANCPASTDIGTATAITPLLSQPLTGPVYLVQGLSFAGGVETHTLPTLLVTLRGQIALDLRAQTSVSRGKLVSTFGTIPDAAVSKFTLRIDGGKKGILVITGPRTATICGKKQVSDATLTAQSGKQESSKIKMSTPCRVRAAGKHGRHDRRRRH